MRFAPRIAVATAISFAGAVHAVTVEDIFREPRLEGTRPQAEAISPDGRWVVYAWNPQGFHAPLDLWVVSATRGAPRKLTSFPRDPRADSLRAAWLAAPPDSLTNGKLPHYFATDTKEWRVESIAWAPDARRIAFVARGELYLADVTGGALPRRLTVTRAAEGDPAWSPDGRALAFVRDGAVWVLEPERGGEMQLTAAGGDSLIPSSPLWSPDGRHLAYTTRDERGLADLLVPDYLSERVTTGRVKEGFPDGGVRVVDCSWLADRRQGGGRDEPFRIVPLALGPGRHPQVSAVAWAPDGRRLAATEVLPDMRTRRLVVADADSGVARTVCTEVDSAWIEESDWAVASRPVLQWSPDGKWILQTSERSGFRHLERVPAAGGAPEPLTQGNWEVSWAHWMPDGRTILLLDNRDDLSSRRLERLNVSTRGLEPFGPAAGTATHPQVAARAPVVLFRHSSFDVPMDLWTCLARPSGRAIPVTHSVPDRFRQVHWVIPEIVKFEALDGTPLRGLVYKPRGFAARQTYPAVVFVHGAGSLQNVLDAWTIYSPNFQFHTVLAERGFVVFEVDYRGSLGYGRDFRTGVHMHLGGKDLDDERAGVEYLKSRGFVDPSRIGIYGGSYGGFLALMALFRAPEDFACGAALRFVADWANYARSNPGYCVQRLGTPAAHPEAYWRSSPLHFAANLRAPLLLLHGVRDDNVHFQDAAQLTERLIRLGKPFDLMLYPREAHGFTAPESWIDEYRRIESFFATHLQVEPHEPVPGGDTR